MSLSIADFEAKHQKEREASTIEAKHQKEKRSMDNIAKASKTKAEDQQ
jgi:hypothetical protein